MQLSKKLLATDFKFPQDVEFFKTHDFREKILQFGEGNFLRAFSDWMIQELNKKAGFNGKVVVVQPIEKGLADLINQQDGLYTLILRGLENGKSIEKKSIISSLSRAINPYTNWQDFLALAKNPELRFVISNTTEAGITYLAEEFSLDKPLTSFPAKLTAFLYQRFNYFQGAPDKGMLIFPCELIDQNGAQLRTIILRLCQEWQLPEAFKIWLEQHNHFFSTLVDRIVTGYPRDEITELEKQLGYEDKLLDVGEIFHLWVIQGDKKFAQELPLEDIGLNIIWTEDLTPYRERKVRVLNGAHTLTVPVAYLAGLNTVKEAVDNEKIGKFMCEAIFREILPTLNLSEEEKNSFALSVIERFQNPYLHHRLIDISLNSISKFKTRCLPTLLDYVKKYQKIPKAISFSLAALIAFYKGERIENNKLIAKRAAGEYQISDADEVLQFFLNLWKSYQANDTATLQNIVDQTLSNKNFWGMNLLQEVPNLAQQVTDYLAKILQEGILSAIKNIADNID